MSATAVDPAGHQILSSNAVKKRAGLYLANYTEEQKKAFNIPVAPKEGPSEAVLEGLRRLSMAIATQQPQRSTHPSEPDAALVNNGNSHSTTILEPISVCKKSRKTALVLGDGTAEKIKRFDESGVLHTTLEDQKRQQEEDAAKGRSEIMQSVDFLEPARLLLEDAFLITAPFRFSILNGSISVSAEAVRDVRGLAQMTYYKNGAVSFDHKLSLRLHFSIDMVVPTASASSRSKEQLDQHKAIKGFIAINSLDDLDDIDNDIVYPAELYTSDPRSDLAGFVGSQVRAAMRSKRCKTLIKAAIVAFEAACVECLKEKVKKRNMRLMRRGALDKRMSPAAPPQRRQSMAGPLGLGIGADRRPSVAGGVLPRPGSSSSQLARLDDTTEMVGGIKRRTSVAATALLMHDLHNQAARPKSRDSGSAIRSSAGRKGEGEITTQRMASVAFNSKGSSILIAGLLDESTIDTLDARHTIRQDAAASRPLPSSMSASEVISKVTMNEHDFSFTSDSSSDD